MERLRITFSGRVQRVGFRATARECAATGRVSGWVRNEHDGTVTMEIQGAPSEIRGVLAQIQQRMGAKITGMDQVPLALEPAESGFVIVH